MTHNDHPLADLVEQLLDVQARMEPLKLAEADLKARIRDAATIGTTVAGEHTVTLTPAKRLDLKAVAAAYPVAQHPELYDLVADTKKVRANLAPADLEQFLTEQGEPRLVIK